jgi:hypothetical protein
MGLWFPRSMDQVSREAAPAREELGQRAQGAARLAGIRSDRQQPPELYLPILVDSRTTDS